MIAAAVAPHGRVTGPVHPASFPADEMAMGGGKVFPHWRPVLGAISGLGPDALAQRALRLRLAAQEESGGPDWRCDPVPLPLPSEEFRTLEAGLRQRATLLDRVLTDLYGPRELLRDGTLPAALVFPNPNYLQACRGTDGSLPSLQVLAVDLMRGPDRQWQVVADRTDGAPGIGYARECRRLLAQVVPELFRTVSVRQLRPFFDAWQEALLRLAAEPPGGRSPLVALLCDGPGDPHWPEHLSLSRDLACALVTPRDLTVRGGVLCLKALSGLQAVDVLLRRVPGTELDPLETPGYGGVAGLLDAARDGAVRVVNRPGAGVIEAPALAAFMPALARQVLGEELLLPGRPTLWLGDPRAAARMAAEPDRWRLCPALHPGAGATADALVTAPWSLAARSTEVPSTAPCAGAERLEARPVVLRMFLMRDAEGWQVMQGGLARVLADDEVPTTWPGAGGVFKDVWVLQEDAATIRGPEPVATAPLPIRRTAVDMPSRVADDFYWLGRYVERMEGQVRLIRAGLRRRARGAPLPREVTELAVLRRALEVSGSAVHHPGGAFEDEVCAVFGGTGAIGGALSQVARLIEALRDRVTVESHGAFGHALRGARDGVAAALRPGGRDGLDPLFAAAQGIQGLATVLAGIAAESMVRGGGRLFLDLGRRVERALMAARVLGTVLDERPARMDAALRLALEIADSAITYRARYLSAVQPAPVLDLLLADTGNPRALAYQFEAMAALLEAAGDAELAGSASALGHVAVALVAAAAGAAYGPGNAAAEAGDAARALLAMGEEVAALSERITRRFFALLPRLQSVGLETA